jgi:hypothetical protein
MHAGRAGEAPLRPCQIFSPSGAPRVAESNGGGHLRVCNFPRLRVCARTMKGARARTVKGTRAPREHRQAQRTEATAPGRRRVNDATSRTVFGLPLSFEVHFLRLVSGKLQQFAGRAWSFTVETMSGKSDKPGCGLKATGRYFNFRRLRWRGGERLPASHNRACR